MIVHVVQSAQESPSATAAILSHHMPGTPRVEECVPSSEVRCADGVCDRRALPYSRFCLHRESVIGVHTAYFVIPLLNCLYQILLRMKTRFCMVPAQHLKLTTCRVATPSLTSC